MVTAVSARLMWGKIAASRRNASGLVGREIAVGIDAGSLNPAVPDVAIDVTESRGLK